MHLFLVGHLLDGVVIDLVLGLIRKRGLAGLLQQQFHQQPVTVEVEPALDVRTVGEALLAGRLRQHHDVGHIIDKVIALLRRRHVRDVVPDFLLGESKVALVDVDAVGAGNDRIAVLGQSNLDRHADSTSEQARTRET